MYSSRSSDAMLRGRIGPESAGIAVPTTEKSLIRSPIASDTVPGVLIRTKFGFSTNSMVRASPSQAAQFSDGDFQYLYGGPECASLPILSLTSALAAYDCSPRSGAAL